MKASIRSAICTLLAADPSVDPNRIPLGLAVIEGREPVSRAGPPEQKEFLTVAEACNFLRCSRTTLHREEKDGRLQAVWLRGRKLFRKQELNAALRTGRNHDS